MQAETTPHSCVLDARFCRSMHHTFPNKPPLPIQAWAAAASVRSALLTQPQPRCTPHPRGKPRATASDTRGRLQQTNSGGPIPRASAKPAMGGI